MKQLLFMFVMVVAGSIGAVYHPFWGVLLYYAFAVMRPQYLWEWALPYEIRWSLIAALSVLLGTVIALPRIALQGRTNAIMWLIVIYGVFVMLSVLTAHNPHVARPWAIEHAKVLLIALIASLIIEHLWQVRLLTKMIIVCLGYVAWEINYLYLFNGRLDIFHLGYGGLDNNGAGLMLAMGIPLAMAYALAAPRLWQKGLCAFAAVLLIHAMMMSYSRGAMVSASVGVAWLLLLHRPRIHAVWAAVALALIISVLAGQEIRDRFMSTHDYNRDGSAQSRFASWTAGWNMALDHPLLGTGVRNSNLFSKGYGADRNGRTIHSQYLQTAADSGIPAMALYLTIMGVAFNNFRRSRGECEHAIEQIDHDLEKTWYTRMRSSRDDEDTHDEAEQALLERRDELQHTVHLMRGFETCLLVFAVGAAFLSLESFELPWMVMVIAGVMPAAVQRFLHPDELDSIAPVADEPEPRRPVMMPHLTKGWIRT